MARETVKAREVLQDAIGRTQDLGVEVVTRDRGGSRPVEVEDVGRKLPGHRRLRWVGEPSPYENPAVEYRLAIGGYTPHQRAVLRKMAELRIAPNPKHSRELTKDRDGLSKDYVWGPAVGSDVRQVRNRDADIILSGSSGHEFRDVDMPEPAHLSRPHQFIRLMKAEELGVIETAARLAPKARR